MAYYRNDENGGYGGMTGYRPHIQWGSLLVALLFAGFAVCKYYGQSEVNEVTGKKQHIGNITKEQEITLGLQSAPSMAEEYGGLYPDEKAQAYIKQVGHKVSDVSSANIPGYQFDFHLLADPNVINAFALPGGQLFITYALFSKLDKEDQLAGIFGHEIGHVIARHGSEKIQKDQLIQGLTGAAVIAAGNYNSSQYAQMIANMVGLKYGRDQELEADNLGVRFMIESGFNPQAMIEVMHILEENTNGNRQPEFYSTHPNPENRIEKIKEAIDQFSGHTNTNGLQAANPASNPGEIKLKDPNKKIN